MNKLINIGYGNAVNSDRVVAVISADSAPARRISQQAKDDNRAIDATQGRKTKAVIIMDSDHIVLSPLLPETIQGRFGGDESE